MHWVGNLVQKYFRAVTKVNSSVSFTNASMRLSFTGLFPLGITLDRKSVSFDSITLSRNASSTKEVFEPFSFSSCVIAWMSPRISFLPNSCSNTSSSPLPLAPACFMGEGSGFSIYFLGIFDPICSTSNHSVSALKTQIPARSRVLHTLYMVCGTFLQPDQHQKTLVKRNLEIQLRNVNKKKWTFLCFFFFF